MVDLHCHLLHALDDGSPSLANSVEMARMAWDDGITHTVCTPHASGRFTFSPEIVADRLQELRAALAAEGVPLVLGSGCDFHLAIENLESAFAEPRRYTINRTEYLLIELPDVGIPRTLSETLYRLRLAGMTPILTHPERNATLQNNPEMLMPWLRDGLLVQVTANSVTGGMGKRAQQLAERFLRDRWVHFLATDAHNTGSRPPVLRAAQERVAKICDAAYAELLCVENPTAVFAGEALPEQQEARGVFEVELAEDESWWERVVKRVRRK
jgi:protein-tyrosine phosphatase